VPSVILAVFPFGICSNNSGIVANFFKAIIFSIFGSLIFFHICFSLFIFGFPSNIGSIVVYLLLCGFHIGGSSFFGFPFLFSSGLPYGYCLI